MRESSETLRAIAHPLRLQIIELLQLNKQLTVTEIHQQLDVEQAVASAKTAFKTWSKTPVDERVRLMLKLADLIEANAEALAVAESRDQGKPVWLARSVS